MEQITLNQKRQYIIPFTWEDYKHSDKLIYKGLVHEYEERRGYNFYYSISLFDWMIYKPKTSVIAVMTDHNIIRCSRGEISLSEVKIDRTPNLLTQLYHLIIDLWRQP